MAVDIANMEILSAGAELAPTGASLPYIMRYRMRVKAAGGEWIEFNTESAASGTPLDHDTYEAWWEDVVNPILVALGFNAPVTPPFNPYPE